MELSLAVVSPPKASVSRRELFFLTAALAGVGWTVSASELWLAAQRAMPNWARGRMNATVIMISQGPMAFGGVLWGFVATTAGVSHALLAAAVPLLISLVLADPLSINFTRGLNDYDSSIQLTGKSARSRESQISRSQATKW